MTRADRITPSITFARCAPSACAGEPLGVLRALLGPLGGIAATLAMFAVAAALYTVANIEDAAAQTTSAVHLVAQRPTWGEVVGLFIVLTIAAASTLALLRDGRRNLTEDDFD